MAEEGEEDSLFFLAEAVTPAASAGGIGPLAVDVNNCVDGAQAIDAPILLSAVHRIYVWKIWWIFAVNGLLLTMITIQHLKSLMVRIAVKSGQRLLLHHQHECFDQMSEYLWLQR